MNRVRALTVLITAAVVVAGLVAPPSTAGSVWLTSNASWTNPDQTASSPLPRVINLRYGHHARFDRVVIRISGSFPGGRSHYQRDFNYDGSGLAVPIRGRSGLLVTLVPAYGHDATGNLYVGPKIARPRFETLKALAYTGDFEGHVSFAFALTHRAAYRVFTLEAPRRIVIDFRHGS